MKKWVLSLAIIVFSGQFLMAQSSGDTWAAAKEAAAKLGVDLPSTSPKAATFQQNKVDDDTFRELKATFESDETIKTVILIEEGNTWVFKRENRWWNPLLWAAAVGLPVTAVGIAFDNGAATVAGAVLGVAGGVVGYMFMEHKDVTDMKNNYVGNAAVYILK